MTVSHRRLLYTLEVGLPYKYMFTNEKKINHSCWHFSDPNFQILLPYCAASRESVLLRLNKRCFTGSSLTLIKQQALRKAVHLWV